MSGDNHWGHLSRPWKTQPMPFGHGRKRGNEDTHGPPGHHSLEVPPNPKKIKKPFILQIAPTSPSIRARLGAGELLSLSINWTRMRNPDCGDLSLFSGMLQFSFAPSHPCQSKAAHMQTPPE